MIVPTKRSLDLTISHNIMCFLREKKETHYESPFEPLIISIIPTITIAIPNITMVITSEYNLVTI